MNVKTLLQLEGQRIAGPRSAVSLLWPGSQQALRGYYCSWQAKRLRGRRSFSHPQGCRELKHPKGSCSVARQHGQLSSWPRGLDRAQAGLSWRTTDAFLDGQSQGLPWLRRAGLLMSTQTGQMLHQFPGGPHQPSRRQHLGVGRSLHPVLYKSTRVHWVSHVWGLCWNLGCPDRVGSAPPFSGAWPLRPHNLWLRLSSMWNSQWPEQTFHSSTEPGTEGQKNRHPAQLSDSCVTPGKPCPSRRLQGKGEERGGSDQWCLKLTLTLTLKT